MPNGSMTSTNATSTTAYLSDRIEALQWNLTGEVGGVDNCIKNETRRNY